MAAFHGCQRHQCDNIFVDPPIRSPTSLSHSGARVQMWVEKKNMHKLRAGSKAGAKHVKNKQGASDQKQQAGAGPKRSGVQEL